MQTGIILILMFACTEVAVFKRATSLILTGYIMQKVLDCFETVPLSSIYIMKQIADYQTKGDNPGALGFKIDRASAKQAVNFSTFNLDDIETLEIDSRVAKDWLIAYNRLSNNLTKKHRRGIANNIVEVDDGFIVWYTGTSSMDVPLIKFSNRVYLQDNYKDFFGKIKVDPVTIGVTFQLLLKCYNKDIKFHNGVDLGSVVSSKT